MMKTKSPKRFSLSCCKQSKNIVEQVFLDEEDYKQACKELLNIEEMSDFKEFYKKWDLNTYNKRIHFHWKAQGLLFTRCERTESLRIQVLDMEDMIVQGYGKAHVNSEMNKWPK